jgi:4-hydroxy-3-methylbut-2-enyl diphosphate reductase
MNLRRRFVLVLVLGRVGEHHDTRTPGWLPAGPLRLGVTAGASTPNNVVGEVVKRILALRGLTPADLQAA